MRKVLVVDDSSTLRQQVRQVLEPAGYQIIEAVDGVEGLDQIRAARNSGAHDLCLVLCDVNMPRMTGIELITRAKEEGLATPIIMLTSEGQPSLVRKARDAGAKAWIVKPFKVELLLAAVNKIAGG